MIPDVSSDTLFWLKANPQALQGIYRGVERETLRINTQGHLAQTPHPKKLGAALTHKWITTDFAETLLEFITPVAQDIDHMLTLLRDIHRHVARHLCNEWMWPMSMPCFIDSQQQIKLAQYGPSNMGRMKTLYRKGLKNRYSAMMQIISGVHYNFSLPLTFWQVYAGVSDMNSNKDIISAGYLGLIRNYYRFGWIIPYIFGASPGVCQSFMKNRDTDLPFIKASSGFLYLPYATSLRMSDLGYANKSQSQLDITFNSLKEYVFRLKHAIRTPYADYQRIGLKKNGSYLQLNTNILQSENELYAPIRPKRITKNEESPLDALLRRGIEYIEVRALDINPFSPVGIDEEQVRFLDLFLIWCTLAPAPKMSTRELLYTRLNWTKVILEGRKPGLTLIVDGGSSKKPLATIGKELFSAMQALAETLDSHNGNIQYQQVCHKLRACIDQPELTLSARILKEMKKYGIRGLGLTLANQYFQILLEEPLEMFNELTFDKEQIRSWHRQLELEALDILSFDDFLAHINSHQQ
ncbi:glutamate--cysteine ligase [Candidatus Palibaumannia cicadellinicola]|uniref:Glutamate--cysteine ligase n=1 Tax=Baumannia cicadellinicola subsp. Homalodisca coagulata TaxID=374463 RepID=GSH1_BAUCH|nr:glutamate--cysteine ligase [Candidatus Baumannia cicadellinicola]Q1LTQ6.1 RecName: Full=Glutamate--cysteine ligase; AltName: Full=Gamma-ECS; Short=GCS; AltName: Full=Gamma-glutamylcysteine synthetase [Baumannia cicadellinicola str. Hc (Homalodisca coagulata)]ABF13792.1 glutamate--cysteine ligase [Baumannia cicadellinicola str. Hc (Homalodisca coagulata)]MBS0032925.1 glutamate--cysteine ligase [Candidatus Baumannia cicadellinicola]MCJ7462359.1 glutamate--cysteine ligase [Candidatus Baumannia 